MVSRKRGTLDLAGIGVDTGHGKLIVRGGSQQARGLLDDVELGVPKAGQEPPRRGARATRRCDASGARRRKGRDRSARSGPLHRAAWLGGFLLDRWPDANDIEDAKESDWPCLERPRSAARDR